MRFKGQKKQREELEQCNALIEELHDLETWWESEKADYLRKKEVRNGRKEKHL